MKIIFLLSILISATPAWAAVKARVGYVKHPLSPVLVEVVRKSLMETGEFKSVDKVEFPSGAAARGALEDKKIDLFVDPGTPVQTGVTLLTRENFASRFPASAEELANLRESLTQEIMDHLNSLITKDNKSVNEAADIFIGSLNWIRIKNQKPPILKQKEPRKISEQARIEPLLWRLAREHLFLTFTPFLLGIFLGLPIGFFARKKILLRQTVSSLTDVYVSIPPLALLCFFIPFFGTGITPVLTALIIYNVLAILRHVMDLPRHHSPREIYRPLLRSSFIGKLKVLAVWNVGIVTVGALLRTGGFGSLIVTGLAINDYGMALKGAMPAALLAICVKWIFEALEWTAELREERINGK